jgi:hypothetical protein
VQEIEVVVSSAAVASDGAPSSNSNLPRRLSTRSGVEMERSVSLDTVMCHLLVDTAPPEGPLPATIAACEGSGHHPEGVNRGLNRSTECFLR